MQLCVQAAGDAQGKKSHAQPALLQCSLQPSRQGQLKTRGRGGGGGAGGRREGGEGGKGGRGVGGAIFFPCKELQVKASNVNSKLALWFRMKIL